MPHILNSREDVKDFNTIYFTDDDDMRVAKLEQWIAKKLGEKLVSTYPRRQWGVNVDVQGRMIIITAPSLSTSHGYHIAMNGDTIDALERRAVDAGGEIMERYGLSRGRLYNPDHEDALPRNLRDEAMSPDVEGVDPIK